MEEAGLKNYFHFNDAELEANRNGIISEKQKTRMKKGNNISRIWGVIGGGFLILVAMLGVGIATTTFPEELGIGPVIALGCIWPFVWGTIGTLILSRAFSKYQVELLQATGLANMVKVEKRSTSNGHTHTYDQHELHIDGRIFIVTSDLANLMQQGQTYTVYYTEGSRRDILSAEAISESQVASMGLDKDELKLQERFRFNNADLSANRSGHVTEKQRRKLGENEKSSSKSNGVLALITFLAAAGLFGHMLFWADPLHIRGAADVLHIPSQSVLELVWGVSLFLFSLFFFRNFLMRQKYEVKKFEGNSTVIKIAGGLQYNLRVGDVSFRVSANPSDLIDPNDVYRFYCIYNVNEYWQLLSLELVSGKR